MLELTQLRLERPQMRIEQMCCPFPKRYGQKTKLLEHKLEGSTGQARAFGQAQLMQQMVDDIGRETMRMMWAGSRLSGQ